MVLLKASKPQLLLKAILRRARDCGLSCSWELDPLMARQQSSDPIAINEGNWEYGLMPAAIPDCFELIVWHRVLFCQASSSVLIY